MTFRVKMVHICWVMFTGHGWGNRLGWGRDPPHHHMGTRKRPWGWAYIILGPVFLAPHSGSWEGISLRRLADQLVEMFLSFFFLFIWFYWTFQMFPSGSDSKESACNAGDPGLIPGLGRFSEESCMARWLHGNPLQWFCLGNPMDRGAWWATVHGVTKSVHDWRTNTFTLMVDLQWC